jgi:hypothetical protein
MKSGIFEMFEEKKISNFHSNGMEVATPIFMKSGDEGSEKATRGG